MEREEKGLSLSREVADLQAIKAFIEETYPSRAMSGDSRLYASMYTPDALWCPPNHLDKRGPADIAAADDAKEADIEAIMRVEDHEVFGNAAFVTAKARVSVFPRSGAAGKTYFYRGFWLLQRSCGGWLIRLQIWNEKPFF
jgi:ketosteroid isomerase-like protein